MFNGFLQQVLVGIITVNQILTAGIAITAFSLFLYALSFNLRDRVARSFALILICVVIIFTSEALGGSASTRDAISLYFHLEWIGIIVLPATYLHLSDGLLEASGATPRKIRKWLVFLTYGISIGFIILLTSGYLLGPLVLEEQPAPYLQRTALTELFTSFYIVVMSITWINFGRAYYQTSTRSGRRRLLYLLAGATAPALGSFPYLLYGSSFAAVHPYIFWGLALINNIFVGLLIILMAYAVAFFGVSWPDRVVRSRLFKWIMRGPVTASVALGIMTVVRRLGEYFGFVYSGAVPGVMVATILVMEHMITLIAPLWDRLIFFGRDRDNLTLLQNIEDRFITQNDLKQYLEAILAAVRDQLQSLSAFVAARDGEVLSLIVVNGNASSLKNENLNEALRTIDVQKDHGDEYVWGDYWLFPLQDATLDDEHSDLIGILGATKSPENNISPDQRQRLSLLQYRASLALQDRLLQKKVFRSLEKLQPQVDMFQRLRAVGRYDSKKTMLQEVLPPESDLASWVKDALTHYWGGPKLTQSPLMQLNIVQNISRGNNENSANALRTILRQAIDTVRPEGERKFTGEWILYNILEMKFIEGRKVREVATRLAVSEADLYRKQRVAIEEVGKALIDMERNNQDVIRKGLGNPDGN